MDMLKHISKAEVVKRAVVVFSPWMIAMALIIACGFGWDTLSAFKNIEGNRFIINDVLFVLIMSSYGVVLIGLILSLIEMRDDLFEYKRNNRSISRLDGWGIVGLFIVLGLLVGSVAMVLLALFGIARLSVEYVVSANRWLSLIIFGLFLGTDYLAFQSKRVQEAEAQEDAVRRQPLSEFYELAILLIDIPALSLSGLMIFLTWYMGNGTYFKGIIDRELHDYVSSEPLSSDVFSLFVHGTEAGVIASIIIFSQVVYLVLKARCDSAAIAPTGQVAVQGPRQA